MANDNPMSEQKFRQHIWISTPGGHWEIDWDPPNYAKDSHADTTEFLCLEEHQAALAEKDKILMELEKRHVELGLDNLETHNGLAQAVEALKYVARGPRPDDSDSAVAKKALSDIGIDDNPAPDPRRTK